MAKQNTELTQEQKERRNRVRENLSIMEKIISQMNDSEVEEFTDYCEGYMAGFVAGNALAKEGAA